MISRLFILFSFYIYSLILASDCGHKYNITTIIRDDDIIVSFPSTNILKLDRSIRCNSTSSFIPVYGCVSRCTSLGFGVDGEIVVNMVHSNGTNETCSMNYIIGLQPASLADISIFNNTVQLSIDRPQATFDYVKVYCSDKIQYVIFNTSNSMGSSIETVQCPFLHNMSLMNFIFETVKKDFQSAIHTITREVPLPIPFSTSIECDSNLLIISANAPPLINIDSTYSFYLYIHDRNNERIMYERDRIDSLNSKLGALFQFGLIPNVKHTIIFTHFVQQLGFAQSQQRIQESCLNISYPYEVTDLQVKEQFNSISISWLNPHYHYDPVEFFVQCNSNNNNWISVGRNTTFICEQILFNETDRISVQTRIVVPGYIHDKIAVSQITTRQIPEVPSMRIFDVTENTITVKWNSSRSSAIPNDYRYKINCGSNDDLFDVNILTNEYQCQSRIPGTLYEITLYVENTNKTIQRLNSILANTLLEKCQYRNHFYSPEINQTHSVIIEWSPPSKNFDRIHVNCPLSSLQTFEPAQLMQIMYVKCIVISGQPFNVQFITEKSGYTWQVLEIIDSITTTTTTTTTTITTTTTTTTTITWPSSTTSTTSTSIDITVSDWNITTSTSEGTPSNSMTTTTTCSSGCCIQLTDARLSLTRWRAAAIVSFILLGFLFLATVSLICLSVLLCLRNREHKSDEE